MKQKVESLRGQRKDKSLDDSDIVQLIKGIKDTLDEDDLKVVNPIIVKAVNIEPEGMKRIFLLMSIPLLKHCLEKKFNSDG